MEIARELSKRDAGLNVMLSSITAQTFYKLSAE
jgi:hypothetical protein